MFASGYWQIARFRGIPLRVHWSLVLGALLFSGFRIEPAFWLGFVLVVLVHEAGHAALVRMYRQHVLSIDITGFGGLTRWSGATTAMQRSVIAWGGVLAQGVLLVATLAVLALAGPPRTVATAELASVLTTTNLWIMGLNLLPIPPLDGALAWRLLPALVERLRRRGPPRRPGAPRGAPRPPASEGAEARRLADLLRQVGNDAGSARRNDRRT